MSAHPKILGKATVTMDREAGSRFLSGSGFWDKMSPLEREAFLTLGEVWDTPVGRRLAHLIGLRGAEFALIDKYQRRN